MARVDYVSNGVGEPISVVKYPNIYDQIKALADEARDRHRHPYTVSEAEALGGAMGLYLAHLDQVQNLIYGMLEEMNFHDLNERIKNTIEQYRSVS